jgi:LPS export ABC transporter protein LptC
MNRAHALLLVFVLGACSLDYGSTQLSDQLDDTIPDTRLIDFTQTIVSDGVPRFVITAEQARTFVDQNRQYLDAIEFEELSREGERIAYGTADSAVFETDTENVRLTGSLEFFSAEEDSWLTAESLYWDSEARTLSSTPEEQVVLRRGDSTRVEGAGFSADLARRSVQFDRGFRGTILQEGEE